MMTPLNRVHSPSNEHLRSNGDSRPVDLVDPHAPHTIGHALLMIGAAQAWSWLAEQLAESTQAPLVALLFNHQSNLHLAAWFAQAGIPTLTNRYNFTETAAAYVVNAGEAFYWQARESMLHPLLESSFCAIVVPVMVDNIVKMPLVLESPHRVIGPTTTHRCHDCQRIQGDRTQSMAAGMDDYISKPMRVQDLMAVLNEDVAR